MFSKGITYSEAYVRGLYKYTGERINTDAAAGTFGVVDEFDTYYTLDLFAGWRSSDFTWDVTVWAKNVTDEGGGVVDGTAAHPVQVEAVRIELAVPRRDESAGTFGRLHLVQAGVDRRHAVGIEPVLVVAQGQDEDVVIAFEAGHLVILPPQET